MTMTVAIPAEGELSVLLVDGQFYMGFPPDSGFPTEKPWITIDPEGDDLFSQAFGSMVEQLTDTTAATDQFTQHADLFTVEEVGSDSIDGVEVTEYLVTVAAEDIAEVLELPAEAELPAEELTYSLWVDEDALSRRLTSDLAGEGSMEMTFFDYGEPVEVEAPPADQVTDFATMLEEELGVSLDDLSEEQLAELEGLLGGGS
jgi:hypothetical protein